MYTPAAKRRRLDDASNTLRKPFKSPAVVRDRDAAAGDATASSPRTDAVDTNSSSTRCGGSATGVTAQRSGIQLTTPAKQFSTPTRRPFSLSRPQRGVSPSPLRTTGDGTPTGIRTARDVAGREEIIRQAERIRGGRSGAGSETDEELVVLIAKWRAASRQAAEEVFEASKERVQSMGGMKAWRKTRREEQKSFLERMMEEEPKRDRDEDADKEDGYSPDNVGAENDGDKDDRDEDEDEEFTLGTMLKSMNIDFEVIGYDEDTGWWRDG
ncbi:Swi5-dependent recombination DNA repair protein 1 [Colletotrichum siamense]|uniref:Swi5-dependent recombination DNA repair protein 1 n=1 Tax=Colletotrichum siamense TaxID=690259 RepID=UPI001872EBBF|nr:Swi5-dependent recombination DNA repair protein 1 [Colletotrichum siamense]KAF5492622.1 Swi5-dependent recombination DNA repair protein 1 [Colletotrichum siamense]